MKNKDVPRLCLGVRLWCTRVKQVGITREIEVVYKDKVGWNYTEGEGPAWVAVSASRWGEWETFRLQTISSVGFCCSQQIKWWKNMCDKHFTCTTRTAIWDNMEKLYKSVDTRHWSVIFCHLNVLQMIQFIFVHWYTDEHIRVNYTTIPVDLIRMTVCRDRVLIWTDWLTYTSKYGLQLYRRANVYVNIY